MGINAQRKRVDMKTPKLLLIFFLLLALCFFLFVVGRTGKPGHIDVTDLDMAKLCALSVAIVMYETEYGELPPEENFKQILLERNIIDNEDKFYAGYGKNILLRYYRQEDNYVLVSPGKNEKYDTPEGYENIKEFREKTDDIIRFHKRIGTVNN